MKAMIWKELRENGKWAALGGVAIALAMAFALWDSGARGRATETVLEDIFQSITISLFPALAAMLGFAQVINESWRDHWSFLLHRPTSRTRLFAGKAIGGLTLYAAAAGVPLLLAGVWASRPGQFSAPFDWVMMQAGVADLFVGAAYYFAAMLTAQRQARWYASRALSFGAAMCLSVYVNMVHEFWQALLGVAVVALVLGTAAWGGFGHGGVYADQPRRAKAAFGLATMVGMGLIGWMAIIIALSLAPDAWQQYRAVNYGILPDGTVVRYVQTADGIEQVTDLQGKPVSRFDTDPPIPHNRFFDAIENGTTVAASPNALPDGYMDHYRHIGRWYAPVDRHDEEVNWFLDTRRRLLLGYDAERRRLTMRAGPDGFFGTDEPPPQSFGPWINTLPHSLQRSVLVCPEAVYHIDYLNRRVATMFEADKDEQIIDVAAITTSGGGMITDPASYPTVWLHAVSTSRRLLYRHHVDDRLRDLGYEYDRRRYGRITVTVAGGRTFVRYTPETRGMIDWRRPEKLVTLNAQNNVVDRVDLVRNRPMSNHTLRAAIGAVTPTAVVAVAFVLVWLEGLAVGEPAFYVADLLNRDLGYPYLMLAAAAALFCAAVNHLLARRYQFDRAAMWWWTLWGFAFGPAGVLLLLCLPGRPAMVRCAACGHNRRVDCETCDHCAAAFADPPRDGTEIFEDAAFSPQSSR